MALLLLLLLLLKTEELILKNLLESELGISEH